jgi:DNA recombination protein RmuC
VTPEHFPILTVFIVGAATGLLTGGLAVWLIMRQAHLSAEHLSTSESQAETARLNERISNLSVELTRYRDKSADWQNKAATSTDLLNTARNDCTRFEERSARVPVIESQLSLSASENEHLAQQLAAAREALASSNSVGEGQRTQIASLEDEVSKVRDKRDQLLSEQERLKTCLAESAAILDAERTQTAEKVNLINEAKEHLTDRFKTLANEILEEKAKRFTEQNQTNIGLVLEPLKVQLQDFKSKVEQVYLDESKDRTALAEQVRQLSDLNQQLSQDANNLAQALKGSSKAQGNWGEFILERILEASGLRNGHEYDVKENHTRPDGSRAQPDVVIHLPQGRELIVDSKVSLTAYDEYCAGENDLVRENSIERHIVSIRQHIRELSQQDYQLLYGVKSVDYVVMFVPIESALALGISHDSKLLEDASKKNVLLVSPSMLLFAVRTVAHLWRQELQNRHVQEVARRGAELYDKLCGFVEDLQEMGKRLEQARISYDSAYAKFGTGRGNVIWQAEALKALGVKPSKTLPLELLESALDESMLPADSNVTEITKTEVS